MKKINVAYIITTLALGGAQKNALYTAANLDHALYNIFFISAPGGRLQPETGRLNAVDVRLVPTLKRSIDPWNDLVTLCVLVRYMKNHSIDIVHTHSSKAGILGRWAARIAGVPVIVHTIHGWSFNDYGNRLLQRFFVWVERWTGYITDAFVAVSESDIEKGLAQRIGRREQYALIRYGIKQEQWRHAVEKSSGKKTWGIGSKTFVVGMVACLKPQKNPLESIRIVRDLVRAGYQVMFFLVGDGHLRRCLETLVQREGLTAQVVLLGWRSDMEALMPLFDVVILTSLWEGLPIALLEAMACGKPVVAYDVDGIRELVQDGITGYLVRPKDTAGFVDRMRLLLDDPARCRDMGKAGQQRVSGQADYHAKTMINNIAALYERLLCRGKSVPAAQEQ